MMGYSETAPPENLKTDETCVPNLLITSKEFRPLQVKIPETVYPGSETVCHKND